MLISKYDRNLFRPGINLGDKIFYGLASKMEITNTNMTNIITKEGMFYSSNQEFTITNSTISRCWGSEYSALIFSI
jgi:hypothetical protein